MIGRVLNWSVVLFSVGENDPISSWRQHLQVTLYVGAWHQAGLVDLDH